MKKCPNCGGLNVEVNQVCGACGTTLPNNSYPNNINNAHNNQKENNSQNQINQKDINDRILIDEYIGNKVGKLKYGSFSWCTLFFSGLYFWYRKMYAFLGIWFAIVFALISIEKIIETVFITKLMATPNTIDTINTIFNILGYMIPLVLAFLFKESYVRHVKAKVAKIKKQNPNKTETELIEICRKKGGTTSAPFIFVAIVFVTAFIIGIIN